MRLLRISLYAALSLPLALLLPSSVMAQTVPKLFSGADPAAGMKLHKEKNCASCHIQRMGGDGSALYTRADRKAKTPDKLLTMVATCNSNLSAGLFPEEEKDVAAYLNRDYYRFK